MALFCILWAMRVSEDKLIKAFKVTFGILAALVLMYVLVIGSILAVVTHN